MNLIAENITSAVTVNPSRPKESRTGHYIIIAAMTVYSILAFGGVAGETNLGMAMIVAIVAYFLAFYVFYGISRLAYRRDTFLLWGGVVIAAIVGYLFSGLTNVWYLLTGWSMLFFGGTIAGRMIATGRSPLRTYIYSAASVAVLVIIQQVALWPEMIVMSQSLFAEWITELKNNMAGMNQDTVTLRDNIAYTGRMLQAMSRLLPAAAILNAVMQFSVAFLIFLYRLDRTEPAVQRLAPFTMWKMPFGFVAVVLLAIMGRFFGTETMTLIADNVLFILAVYYCLTGLGLVEHFLSRLRVSLMVRVLFYILLFFSQLLGFFAAALLGLIDSFTDWRKTQHIQTVAM